MFRYPFALFLLIPIFSVDLFAAEYASVRGLDPQPTPHIVFPRMGAPAWLSPGEHGMILIQGLEPAATPTLALRYQQKAFPLTCSRTQAQGADLCLTWTPPQDLPESSLFDLCLKWGGGALTVPNAVYIGPYPQATLEVIQMTDLEVRPADPAPAQRLAQAIEEINLIHPDCVIATGDLTYSGKPDQFEMLQTALARLRVPLFTLPGNTEHHGEIQEYYRRLNPFQDYALSLGPFRLIALNTGDNYHPNPEAPYNALTDNRSTGLSAAQRDWLATQLAAAPESPLLLATHFPAVTPFDNRAAIGFHRPELLRLCRQHNVAAVLSGHTHMNAIHCADGRLILGPGPLPESPLFIATAATASAERLPRTPHSYRRIRLNREGLISVAPPLGEKRQALPQSLPLGKLRYTMRQEGRSYIAEVHNGHTEAFPDAHLTFSLPPESPPQPAAYHLDEGRITRIHPGEAQTEVTIVFHLPPATTLPIRLAPLL